MSLKTTEISGELYFWWRGRAAPFDGLHRRRLRDDGFADIGFAVDRKLGPLLADFRARVVSFRLGVPPPPLTPWRKEYSYKKKKRTRACSHLIGAEFFVEHSIKPGSDQFTGFLFFNFQMGFHSHFFNFVPSISRRRF